MSGASTKGVLKGAGNCADASVMLTAAMSVQVDTSNDATNYFCGGHFGVMSGAMTSGVVRCKKKGRQAALPGTALSSHLASPSRQM